MIKITKGLSLPISGAPAAIIEAAPAVTQVALLGQDYLGLKPSLRVNEGDEVQKGDPLWHDKTQPDMVFTAPATGKINTIMRGERRALKAVVIDIAESEQQKVEEKQLFADYKHSDLVQLNREKVQKRLLASGLWTALRTRPFSKIPAPNTTPYAIFVTAIDTHPLGFDPALVITPQQADFDAGLSILSRLTDGKVHICHGAKADFAEQYVEHPQLSYHAFSGPHPAGLVGTHIHYLAPVSLTRWVWHIGYQDVIAIGKLFTTGKLFTDRIIALAGPQVCRPRLLKTFLGANLTQLITGELIEGESRVLSGSILSGNSIQETHGFLGRYHHQISVLAEGREQEFFGWIKPSADKFSITATTIGHFLSKRFAFTTALNGGRRSMVPIGNYEQVMPLDILPTLLLRDLLSGDNESAQQLGCLELDEEDLALCGFVCPGKYEYGPALRTILTQIEREE